MNRFRPLLSALEERCTPALGIAFNGADLSVTGTPDDPANEVTIDYTIAGVEVRDGLNLLATHPVTGNLNVNLGFTGDDLTINVNIDAGTFPQGINIRTSNDNATVNIVSGSNIAGNVTITTAGGDDNITLTAADGDGISVQGSVSINAGTNTLAGGDVVSIGGEVPDVTTGGPVTIQGLLNATAMNTLTLEESAVQGHALVRFDNATANAFTLDALSVVEGNLVITGSNSAETVTVDGIVGGSMTANMLGGSDTVNIGLAAQVNRDTTLVLGNGGNTATIDGTIGGNLTVLGGNLADSTSLSATSVVGGRVYVNLNNSGAGANVFNLNGIVFGPQVLYYGGSGVDNVDVSGAIAPGARLMVLLGAGNDSFTVDATAFFAFGFVDGGFGNDTISNNATFPLITRGF